MEDAMEKYLDEIEGAHEYRKCAANETDPNRKAAYEQMAEDEMKHAKWIMDMNEEVREMVHLIKSMV